MKDACTANKSIECINIQHNFIRINAVQLYKTKVIIMTFRRNVKQTSSNSKSVYIIIAVCKTQHRSPFVVMGCIIILHTNLQH